MDVPTPPSAVAAFAAFVRQRLADVGETLPPLWTRRDEPEALPATTSGDGGARTAAKHLAMVIIGAAAPFAPTSHARVRLLRQAHASGLLSARETEQAVDVLGAPR
jgi:hypothetical protein